MLERRAGLLHADAGSTALCGKDASRISFQWRSLAVFTQPPCAIACINIAYIGAHFKNSLSWNTSVLIDSFENRPVGVFGVPGNVSGKGTHFQHESGSLRSFKVQDYAVEYLMDAQESLGASDEVRTGRGCSSVA